MSSATGLMADGGHYNKCAATTASHPLVAKNGIWLIT